MRSTADPEIRWLAAFDVDGELNFRIGRHGDELVADWPGICSLWADRRGAHPVIVEEPGVEPELLDKLYRGLVRALLRHLQAKLTIHGSAVAFGDRAVAAFGESRAGKSTLAAALARRPGARFVADDTVAVEMDPRGAVTVIPTETVSWLLPDAQRAFGVAASSRKDPVAPPETAHAPSRLAALVELRFDDGVRAPELRPLRGQDALARIVPSVVRFVLDEPAAQLREVDQLATLLDRVPTYALVRPRDLGALEASVDCLVALAGGS